MAVVGDGAGEKEESSMFGLSGYVENSGSSNNGGPRRHDTIKPSHASLYN